MSVFTSRAFDNHELVSFHSDRRSGLRAIIAVHNTRLGPGVGGCRMYPYANDADALHDVLRKRCVNRGVAYLASVGFFFKAHGNRFSKSPTVSACGSAVNTWRRY